MPLRGPEFDGGLSPEFIEESITEGAEPAEGAWQAPEEDRDETLRMKAQGREYRKPQSPHEDPYPISDTGYSYLQQQKEDRTFYAN